MSFKVRTLLSRTSGPQTHYCRASTRIVGGQGWSMNFRGVSFWSDQLRKSTEEVPVPGEFLHQGGVFDQFGNKSVINLQYKGTVSSSLDVGYGLDPVVVPVETSTAPTNVFRTYQKIFSMPGCVKMVPPGYGQQYLGNWFLLDEAPLYVVAGSENQPSWNPKQTTLCACAMMVVGKYPACGVLSCQVVATYIPDKQKLELTDSFTRGSLPNYSTYQEGYDILWGGWYDLKDKLSSHFRSFESADTVALDLVEYLRCYYKAFDYVVTRYCEEHPSYVDQLRGKAVNLNKFETITADASSIRLLDDLLNGISSGFDFTKSELSIHARKVVDESNDFTSNLIAYASDLRKTGDTVRSLIKLKKNPGSLKNWASAWLSGRYGDRLAISDTKELFESLQRRLGTRMDYALARKRLTKTETGDNYSLTRSRTSTLVASNESYSDVMTGIYNLMKWDAWPTLENTWDLIPLSFVVDWALPVQDLLGQIDAAVEAPYIKPISSYIGERFEVQYISTIPGMVGAVSRIYYVRQPYNILNDIRPFDVNVTPPSFSVVHMTDALALLVQTSKRA